MGPSQVSSILRRIATAIDNSHCPDRRFVVQDLQKVMASFGSENENEDINLVVPTSGLSASGKQDRFVHESHELIKPTRVKIEDPSVHPTSVLGIGHIVGDPSGEWTAFGADMLNKAGQRDPRTFDFITNGKLVLQCVGDTVWDASKSQSRWDGRGGISQTDIDWMLSQHLG